MRAVLSILLGLATMAAAAESAGKTWDVPSECTTIQAGIDSAGVGDTVFVECGVYHEFGISMKSGVTLLSNTGEADCVTIDADNLGRVIYCSGVDSLARIEGFTFLDGSSVTGAGIYCDNSSPRVVNCMFFSNGATNEGGGLYCGNSSRPLLTDCGFGFNSAAGGGGIRSEGGSFVTLVSCTLSTNNADHGAGISLGGGSVSATGCLFWENTAGEVGGGIKCYSSSYVTATDCVFSGNSAGTSGGAVDCSYASTAILDGCTLAGNSSPTGGGVVAYSATATLDNAIIALGTEGEAVYCASGGSATLTCCDVYGNAGGDWVGCISGQGTINNNFSGDPLFCDPDNGDFQIAEASPCADAPGCGLVGALGVGCGYVWDVPAEAPTIQAGLDSASAGDTVVVACGTYNESNITMPSGVWLRSETGQPDCVTIDADSVSRVFYCDHDTVTIEGFTITGGYTTASGWPGAGAGFHIRDGHITAINCVFSGNATDATSGGGLHCLRASATLTNCSFLGNSAGNSGGGFFVDSAPIPCTLTSCTFSDNNASYAGALFIDQSAVALDQCDLTDNTAVNNAGGVYLYESSTITMSACTVAGNSATLGGGIYVGSLSSATVDSTIIAFSPQGEAVYCSGSGSATLSCCDVYGNAGGDWADCIAGQGTINNNFSEDPLFCDPVNGDYQLFAASPCADAAGCGLVGALGVNCTWSVIHWVGNGDGVSWDDPDNWNLGRVPATGDSVQITMDGTYTVELDYSTTVDQLTVGGGTGAQTLLLLTGVVLTLTDDATVESNGRINVTSEASLDVIVEEKNPSTLVNHFGGTIQLDGGDITGSAIFQNMGLIKKTDASPSVIGLPVLQNQSGAIEGLEGLLTLQDRIDNSGRVFIDAGATIAAEDSFYHRENAVLEGEGSLNISAGDFVGDGAIKPGSSPGILSFTGDFLQSATSELNVEIGGLTAGTHYDQLSVTGTALLDGAVHVTLIDGFVPSVNDSFTVVVVSGPIPTKGGLGLRTDFECFSGLDLPGNIYLEPVQLPNAFLLVAADSSTGNIAPVAADDVSFTDSRTPITIALLLNDTDINGDDLTIVSVSTEGTSGTVFVDAGDSTVTYAPYDYVGTDSFTYFVTDCKGGVDSAGVTVIVTRGSYVWEVPGDVITIQAGIDSAVAGDTVLVANGTYAGADNKNLDFGGKDIVLKSDDGRGTTVIDCEGDGRGFYFHSGETSAAVLDGITIRNGAPADGSGGGIYVQNSSPTVIRCSLIGNSGPTYGGGVRVAGGSPTFSECIITGNRASYGAGFYSNSTSGNPVFTSCTVAGNEATMRGGGFRTYNMASLTITTTIVWGNCLNSEANEMALGSGTSISLTCCDVDSSGIENFGTLIYVADNIFTDPLFCVPVDCDSAPTIEGDYTLDGDSPCLAASSPCGQLIGALGEGCQTAEVGAEEFVSARYFLSQNAPNPFNPTTHIQYEIPKAGLVDISIYDVTGRLVTVLARGRHDAGAFVKTWDGRNAAGREVSTGIYFVRMQASDFVAARKMVLLK